jgi:hypothetical protein
MILVILIHALGTGAAAGREAVQPRVLATLVSQADHAKRVQLATSDTRAVPMNLVILIHAMGTGAAAGREVVQPRVLATMASSAHHAPHV